MAKYILKRKNFTKWDETDNLKRMKDSDILAEQKKPTAPGLGPALGTTAAGTAIGAGVGAAAMGIGKGIAGKSWGAAAKGLKTGGIAGAALGGLVAGTMALSKVNKNAEANNFYNKRLEYAQRQARRREKKDWKANMTQRDGYSY